MPEFNTFDATAKAALLEKLGAVLKDNGLGDVPISKAREMVFNGSAGTYEDTETCSISKNLPASDAAKVEKAKKELEAALEGTTGVKLDLNAQLGPGDQYQTIGNLAKCSEDGAAELPHVPGQVLLVDFWATWCPPCQAPMQHNVDMLAQRAADWKDKVRIIGISIDQTKDAVNTHVAAKKWESVEHYHRAESDCSKVYSVRGVPHVMLIDKDGKIAFKGHPANRANLEQDLDDLAAGKTLTGEGTGPAPAEAAAAIPEGFSEMDQETLGRELEANKVALEAFTKDDELKTHAEGCPRAFCVVVCAQDYIPATGKTLTKYENYRVVVGPKDKIEHLKTTFADKMKGSFKEIIREQAI